MTEVYNHNGLSTRVLGIQSQALVLLPTEQFLSLQNWGLEGGSKSLGS